ncbi:MAG: von Willebrand factor type A domain-containing protein [Cytophagales bacterium]|nr:von Willebrand factor type A domain-containing protein [Cytophagales bacterium]
MSKLAFTSVVLLFVSWLGFAPADTRTVTGKVTDANDGSPLPGVSVVVKGTSTGTTTDANGTYSIRVADEKAVLVFSFIGYVTEEVKVGDKVQVDVKMNADVKALSEVVTTGRTRGSRVKRANAEEQKLYAPAPPTTSQPHFLRDELEPEYNTEAYNAIQENTFRQATQHPLSTFSIDVDAASYANVRRFLNSGQKPPKDAVRIEEMVNYFHYDYPQPRGEDPFSVTAEVSECPWNNKNRLVHIGLQGRNIPTENLPPSNLVFLVDVSGSMQDPNKLPLLKSAFGLLVEQLRPQDHVAMVVYAGAAGLVLPSTPGNEKEKIRKALERLEAGGSTAGGAGIKLAYQTARENFRREGNNRVILATDGDFNVGASSDAEMQRLIEDQRQSGVFLTVLGFGMGNYKDSKMETLADKGNGNYAYIDNIQEGRKVLVSEFGGTLFTIAKDVKIQVEFNPARVKAYRLVGYENRALQNEDFNNDKKDAGELGSGHSVTALYEIVPADGELSGTETSSVDPLKYQKNTVDPKAYRSKEMMTVKLRYKKPDGETSKLIETTVTDTGTPLARTSDNFRFSAAVAAFGMLLRDSEFKGNATYRQVADLAAGARGRDAEGYRIEFINLVKSSEFLQARR